MLRECARYEALAKIMLHSEEFFNFFRYVEVSTFDIASDAFSTFKVKRTFPVDGIFGHFIGEILTEFIVSVTHVGVVDSSQNLVCRISGSKLR